ncbi:MAG: hypothetical protein OXI38_06875 [Bacteroidota bacterium]|nr:hypothetical protein [Bacteroidota bacterium]
MENRFRLLAGQEDRIVLVFQAINRVDIQNAEGHLLLTFPTEFRDHSRISRSRPLRFRSGLSEPFRRPGMYRADWCSRALRWIIKDTFFLKAEGR